MKNIPDILARIAKYKQDEVDALKSQTTLTDLRKQAYSQPAPRGFTNAVKAMAPTGPALITEVKKASPSKGIIREDFDPVAIARAYESGGAACLSVLTDNPSFQGSNDIFKQVRAVSTLPLLRKDFMLEPIQITESRAIGADAILVILAMVDDRTARALLREANALGMDALVECHDAAELTRAVKLGASLIGINNRDLRTFETSLETFGQLSSHVSPHITLIAESGIFTPDDILSQRASGADGFLVGESLMRQTNVEKATKILRGCVRP